MDLWLKDLKTFSSPDVKVFLVGNKADLEDQRIVSKEEAIKYKNEYEINYFKETSAKTGLNATEIFVEAARELYKDYELYKKEKKNKEEEVTKTKLIKKNIKNNNNQKKKCC